MFSTTLRSARGAWPWIVASIPCVAAIGQDTLPKADFLALDSPRREFCNFNIETVRGMVWSPDRSRLFAINTHGSRLVMHQDGDGVLDANWTTLHNPVAVATWVRNAEDFDVLVVGGATHALALHDPNTGDIEDLLILPSEPADIVVSPDHHAFVSCMGADVVVEVDLASFSVLREYAIPSQRPRFLFLDTSEGEGYRVFVAPAVAGSNNRTVGRTVQALPQDDPATPVLEGLPDEDLFELVPPAGGTGPGTVAPLVKGLGQQILEHARSPFNGDYWVLSIVCMNDDPARQTEPALRGDFALNAATVLSLPPRGGTPVIAPAPIDLDDSVTGGTKNYAVSTSCSFPFALAIDPVTGFVMVASSTNDRLVVLDPAGVRVWQRDLPAGSIPRDILWDPPSQSWTVYCWGTNELRVYPTFDLNAPALVLPLGLDPTPASIAAGRGHWYDARNSLNGRSTCNTCHPGGGSDFLGWPLSDDPLDRKDVMVTQSLLSTEDTFPYHWRGERQLRDFNRKAFPGLLGGASLSTVPGGDFEEFQEFVFSLQAPRQPHESWDRVVDDALAGAGISAVQGQVDFNNVISLPPFKCAECHKQPEGSIGSPLADNGGAFTTGVHLDVAHLRQLYNKDGGKVSVTLGGTPTDLPLLGFGLQHFGAAADVFDFLRTPPNGAFNLTPQERLDVTAFVEQFDQGIAPAAQLAWLLAQGHDGAAGSIQRYLLNQAPKGWLDVVAFGTIRDSSGATVFARWLYDPSTLTFTANDAQIVVGGNPAGTATFADFMGQAAAGTASNVFLGLPPGAGQAFALDPDRDDLLDWEELALMPPSDTEDPDTDGDGYEDGHEVDNNGDPTNPNVIPVDNTFPGLDPLFPPALLDTSAQHAEYELRFTEPVSYTISAQRTTGGPVIQRSRLHTVTGDTIAIQELRPSSMPFSIGGFSDPGVPATYNLTISMTDRGNNTTTTAISSQPTTRDQLETSIKANLAPNNLPLVLTVGGLTMQTTSMGSTLSANVTVNVAPMHEGLAGGSIPGIVPQQNQVVVAQVLEDTGSGWTVVPGSRITSTAYTPGYWFEGNPRKKGALSDVLVSPATNAAGDTALSFSVSGLSSGTKVRYNVVAILVDTGSTQGGEPVYTPLSFFAWSLPLTEDDPGQIAANSLRGVEVTF